MKATSLSRTSLRELAKLDRQQLFSTIYREKYWGHDGKGPFYSGSGSYDIHVVAPYIHSVRDFLQTFSEKPVLVDLGCGDFEVGRQLSDLCHHYHGCDIVPELIDFNRRTFSGGHITFHCIDATTEKLPAGDILIVRQVLQHLSNDDISAIMQQFEQYHYLLLTEHLPAGDFKPNIDKPAGPDSRLRFKSGVQLTEAPFCLKPVSSQILCENANTCDFGGVITTSLYRLKQ